MRLRAIEELTEKGYGNVWVSEPSRIRPRRFLRREW